MGRQATSIPSRGSLSQSNTSTTTTTRSSWFGSAVSVGSSALALYGAYQLASLVYDTFHEERNEQEEEETVLFDSVYEPPIGEQTTNSTSTTNPRSAWQSLWTTNGGRNHEADGVTRRNTRLSEDYLQDHARPHHRRRPRNHRAGNLARQRRQQLRHCRDQVREVLYRLIPSVLKRMILESTDFQKERQALKNLRSSQVTLGQDEPSQRQNHEQQQQERALWDTILLQSLTRLVVTVYAPSLLFVVLTVQVSVILGSENQASQDANLRDYQWILDQTYQYMFQYGLPSLIDTVRRIVSDVLVTEQWTVVRVSGDAKEAEGEEDQNSANEHDAALEQISPIQLTDVLMKQVHLRLRQDAALNRQRSLLRFVQPPSVVVDDDEEEEDDNDHCADEEPRPQTVGEEGDAPPLGPGPRLRQEEQNEEEEERRRQEQQHRLDLLDETWDLLESPMVEDAIQDALHTLEKLLIQDIFLEQGNAGGGGDLQHCQQSTSSVLPPSLPLAQVLTRIKKVCQSFYNAFVLSSPEEVEERSEEQVNDCNSATTKKARANIYMRTWEHLPPVIEAMDYFFDGLT